MQQLAKVSLGLIFLLLVAIPAVWSDSAETTNHAAIVVDYGNGSVDTACVAFQEPTISGYDLLSRSGLTLLVDVQGGMGAAICSIGNVGCPASNCFCDAPNFWQYSYLDNNQWQAYQLGASSSTIENGDVDGWAWGQTVQPQIASFDQICSAEINTPTPSPTATNTLTPSSTPTPSATPTTAILPTRIVATATPTPRTTNTPIPTQLPTATPTGMPAVTETPTQTPTQTATATATTEAVATNSDTTDPAATPTEIATNTPSPTDVPDSAETESQPTATQLPTATPIIVSTSTPRPVTTSAAEESQTAAPTATPSPEPTQSLPTATSSLVNTVAPPTLELREPLGEAPTDYDEVASTPEVAAPTTPVDTVAISAETSATPTPIAIAMAEQQPPTPEPIIFDPPGAGNGAVAARVIGADAQLASAFIPAAIQPAPATPSQLSVMLPYLIFAAIISTLTLLIGLAGRNKTRHLSR